MEFKEANKLRLGETTHEILDFIELSNVSRSECGSEVTIFSGASPSVLMRAVPYSHSKSRIARERCAHQILLANDLVIVDGILSGESRQAALCD